MAVEEAERARRARNSDRAWHLAVAVVLGSAAVRLALSGLIPLFPDETYYWDWSRRPAASYFDHPPGIAGLIGFGTALFGHTRVGVRFGALVLGLLGSLAAIATARRLDSAGAALRAALVLAVLPMAAVGLLLATPDAPLLSALAVSMWALVRALEGEPGTPLEIGWWCVSGLALGAAMLSKYTAVLLPAGAALGFALDPRLRRRLLTPGPWIGVGLALAAFAPVLMWNAERGWPSFVFQLRHGLGSGGTGAAARVLGGVSRELEFLGGQLSLVSPILWALLALATARALRDGLQGRGDARKTVLAAIALLVFLTFALSSLRRRVEPNWPAPAYVAGVVLLATAAMREAGRRWLTWGLWLGAALVAVVFAQALVPLLPIDARRDPVAQAHGWESLAAATGDVRAHLLASGCPAVHIATNRYQEASELAFHLPDHPTVSALNIGRRSNQYALWPGFEDTAKPRDCLVFVDIDDPGARRIAEELGSGFGALAEIGHAQRRRGGRVTADYRLCSFTDWTGKPLVSGSGRQPPPRSR
jgi:4-amino-4-deoxy-L-arabinose transferase-like glycosyltransferase